MTEPTEVATLWPLPTLAQRRQWLKESLEAEERIEARSWQPLSQLQRNYDITTASLATEDLRFWDWRAAA